MLVRVGVAVRLKRASVSSSYSSLMNPSCSRQPRVGAIGRVKPKHLSQQQKLIAMITEAFQTGASQGPPSHPTPAPTPPHPCPHPLTGGPKEHFTNQKRGQISPTSLKWIAARISSNRPNTLTYTCRGFMGGDICLTMCAGKCLIQEPGNMSSFPPLARQACASWASA